MGVWGDLRAGGQKEQGAEGVSQGERPVSCGTSRIRWKSHAVSRGRAGSGVGFWEAQRGQARDVITQNTPDQIWCATTGRDRGPAGMGRNRICYNLPTFQTPFWGPLGKALPMTHVQKEDEKQQSCFLISGWELRTPWKGFLFFNWRKLALQCCAVFRCTIAQISHNYIYIPSPMSLPPLPRPTL